MITSVELRDLLVDHDKACALTTYRLQPPGGPAFTSDVAEVFAVRDGKISSLDIYFDSSPFPK
jgi:ketosteroid isomerase-like protein